MPTVSSLFYYPVKSCRGLSRSELGFDRLGVEGDRRWMVVDPEGRFLSLRRNVLFGQLQPAVVASGLRLSAPGMPCVEVRVPRPSVSNQIDVRVWKYLGKALDAGTDASRWLSQVLGEPCRLVYFDPKQRRSVTKTHTDLNAEVAFADGYPGLLTSVESLGELNRRLATPLPMNRFRPNIVVRDCRPFEEDEWVALKAEGLTVHLVKPCERCITTCVDIEHMERGKEPLRTLARFRRNEQGVLFGQNVIIEAAHGVRLRVGQELEIVRRRPPIDFRAPQEKLPSIGERRLDA